MNSIKSKKLSGILIMFLMLITLTFATGCGEKENGDTTSDANGKSDTELSGTITIAGSTSVQPFAEVVAEGFMALHPKTQINVQGGGSSQGVEAATTGAANLGMSSRELKTEEKGLKEYILALDGIALVVHPDNIIENLSIEEIRDIYLGNITNWNELGGKDAKIAVVCREAGSGTRGAFEDIVMNKQDISNTVIIQNSTGAVRTAVEGNKDAIGFVSLAALSDEVKTVKVDNVEANVENIIAGKYKVSRPFLLLSKEEPTGLAKAFIDFALSPEGQALVVEEGGISTSI